jgi:predicted ATPase/DNA-binding CsgD family transcriptional regulator
MGNTAPSNADSRFSSVVVAFGDRTTGHGSRLPVPLTSLIGRDDDISAVSAMLDSDDVRLVTLVGTGGIGKTRVALAVATQLADAYAHGVRFIALASIREPDLVATAIARSVDVHEVGDRSAAEIATRLLADQHMLLVLDNFEQVLGAGAWLNGLLAACPRLKALVTSRAPLRVNGEHRYPLAPLPVPTCHVADIAALPSNYSVALFLQRASEIDPAFTLTNANAEAICTICRRLDGLPLAIELAAARLGMFSPPALATRLRHWLLALDAGLRDAPLRHQSMQQTIAWSEELLTDEARRVLRTLSVFVGGISLEAVEAVSVREGYANQAGSVLDAISTLVDHHLLQRTPTGDDEPRLDMYEPIRDFELEQLTAHGEERRARDAHAAYFAQLVGQAQAGLKSERQVQWLDRLEREHANIQAAIAWLAETGAVGQAQLTAGSLWFFWWVRGYFAQGREILQSLLVIDAPVDAPQDAAGRAKALSALAVLAVPLGDCERALALHEEALDIYRGLDDTEGIAWVRLNIHHPLIALGDISRSFSETRESLELARTLGDAWMQARAIGVLAVCHLEAGEAPTAMPLLLQAERGARALGDRWIVCHALLNRSFLLATDAAFAGSGQASPEELLEECIRLVRELGDKRVLPAVLIHIGVLRRNAGDLDGAATAFSEALDTARQTGDKHSVAGSLALLAQVVRKQGDLRRAISLCRESLALEIEQNHPENLAEVLAELAQLAASAGLASHAATLLGSSDAVYPASSQPSRDQMEEREALLGDLAGTLGRDAFAAATEAGRKLDPRGWMEVARQVERAVLDSAAAGQGRQTNRSPVSALSGRELEVLRLMADGYSNQQIADALYISLRTVTNHVTNILGKIGAASRTAAVAIAIRRGLA